MTRSISWGVLLDCLGTTWTQACLFTRLESLAWSQQGFWQPSYFRKRKIWNLRCDVRTGVVLLCIDCIENRTSWGKSLRHNLKPLYIFPLFQEIKNKKNTTLFPHSKQRLHKYPFLQKLGWLQKPWWDNTWTIPGDYLVTALDCIWRTGQDWLIS